MSDDVPPVAPTAPAAARFSSSRPWRRDLLIVAASALLLLVWDFSGGDLAVARQFGHAHGFPLRNAWMTATLIHEGGRLLSGLLLALMAMDAARPLRAGPTRVDRLRWLGATLLCLVAVPAIKQITVTSCPWDLFEFGGVARYVSHWHLGISDGGGGMCFPSGHATAAFAFFTGFFLWRHHQPRLATGWLVAVLVAGAAFGAGQVARGAHYPSHVAWTAWLCWVICLAVDRLPARPRALLPVPYPIKP